MRTHGKQHQGGKASGFTSYKHGNGKGKQKKAKSKKGNGGNGGSRRKNTVITSNVSLIRSDCSCGTCITCLINKADEENRRRINGVSESRFGYGYRRY